MRTETHSNAPESRSKGPPPSTGTATRCRRCIPRRWRGSTRCSVGEPTRRPAHPAIRAPIRAPRPPRRLTKGPIRAWIRPKMAKLVPHTGFEPVISALRGRCPRPLDECGTDQRSAQSLSTAAEPMQTTPAANRACAQEDASAHGGARAPFPSGRRASTSVPGFSSSRGRRLRCLAFQGSRGRDAAWPGSRLGRASRSCRHWNACLRPFARLRDLSSQVRRGRVPR